MRHWRGRSIGCDTGRDAGEARSSENTDDAYALIQHRFSRSTPFMDDVRPGVQASARSTRRADRKSHLANQVAFVWWLSGFEPDLLIKSQLLYQLS